MSARDRILERVREALSDRESAEHPGTFGGWRSTAAPTPVDGLVQLLEAAGGEVVLQPDVVAAAAWLASFCADFASSAVGETVPDSLRPPLPASAPDTAPLGVSLARGAVAETGSLIMDARDGRRAQLLVPTHVVFVHIRDVRATLRDALIELANDLPSAIGLHSGPSKSADIGQILVKGVHGPGRLVAVLIASVNAH
jgi:L-lactate dehydrogenase complex protein LldG